MCGIAGFIGRKTISQPILERTIGLMRKRGPDHQACYQTVAGDLSLTLLHSRLAIIDLDPRSNQPFTRGERVLVFNGEIYNYIELRKHLMAQGQRFSTASDTEVLMAGFESAGMNFFESCEGMWALALWDSGRRELILSRDRFGEKPLYYLQTQEGIYFGSETRFLKSLSDTSIAPDESQILSYLANGYRSNYKHDRTFLKGIREVSAASHLIIDAQLKTNEVRYWNLRYEPKAMSREDATAGTIERLRDSIRLRLRSDVPLAFCLSGGVDSGALVSIAAKELGCDVSCYSIIDTDSRYDESKNIAATVSDSGCKWHGITIQKENSLERLRQLIKYHDSPIATVSYYVHAFLSEAIAADKKKVVFSGSGADELFTGYYDHYLMHLYETRATPQYPEFLRDWQTYVLPIIRNVSLRNADLFLENPNFRDYLRHGTQGFSEFFRGDFDEPFTELKVSTSLLRNRMLNEIRVESMPIILHEDDLNSMYYSLENRSPYLDSRLAEFAFTIPNEMLIKNGYAKSILRDSLSGVLNDTVRLDRQKKGFNASLESVFDLSSPRLRAEILDESPIYALVDRSKIEQAISSSGFDDTFGKFLFSFLSAKLFMEESAKSS